MREGGGRGIVCVCVGGCLVASASILTLSVSSLTSAAAAEGAPLSWGWVSEGGVGRE